MTVTREPPRNFANRNTSVPDISPSVFPTSFLLSYFILFPSCLTPITPEIPGRCFLHGVKLPYSPHCYRSPWVILSDFGGAFSMGAVGGGIWYGIKGSRNSPRVRVYYAPALCSSLAEEVMTLGRTFCRCHILHESTGPSNRRQLRCMGWHVLDV